MKRLALLSDVHGNSVALERVLADIEGQGLGGAAYCLGDIVGYGPDPSGAIVMVRDAGIPTIRGNYDDGIGNHRGECGCFYASETARSDGAASYAFTDRVLSDDEHRWLAELPDELRLEILGLRVLLVHGSPRKINEYLLPDRTDEQLARLADKASADVVCVGHVHVPYHRAVAGPRGQQIHYVSSGSVGKPKDGDPRAGWVELVFGSSEDVRVATAEDCACGPTAVPGVWLGAVVHRAEYDARGVADRVVGAGLPASLAEALLRA